MEENKLKEIQEKLQSILNDTDLNNIDPNSDYEELSDGYYLSELTSAKIDFSKAGKLQVVLQFKITEQGQTLKVDDTGIANFVQCGGKGRTLFKYYNIETPENVRKFAKDMLKFEDENGNSILTTEYFTTPELMYDALDVLVGLRLYLQSSTSKNDKGSSTWINLISWKRAASLELTKNQ